MDGVKCEEGSCHVGSRCLSSLPHLVHVFFLTACVLRKLQQRPPGFRGQLRDEGVCSIYFFLWHRTFSCHQHKNYRWRIHFASRTFELYRLWTLFSWLTVWCEMTVVGPTQKMPWLIELALLHNGLCLKITLKWHQRLPRAMNPIAWLLVPTLTTGWLLVCPARWSSINTRLAPGKSDTVVVPESTAGRLMARTEGFR